MAQHDYVIDNQSFPATRSDLNSLFQAIASCNSGATEPSTTYANQLWYDTTNNKLYIRNEDNDAWIELFVLDQTGDHLEKIGDTITLDGSGNIGIGISAPDGKVHAFSGDASQTANAAANQFIAENSGNAGMSILSGNTSTGNIYFADNGDNAIGFIQYKHSDNYLRFGTAGAERARLTSSGDLLVGKDTTAIGTAGSRFISNGQIQATASNNEPFFANRLGSSGDLFDFRKDGTTVGSIGIFGGNTLIIDGTASIYAANNFRPNAQNTHDLGSASYRWRDIFTLGAVDTSDRNEKQQIAELTATELAAAKRISALFKTFKWNHAVETKGDNARIHAGIIAQDVKSALEAEGLDASKYSFWCSDTWWEHDVEVPAVEAVEAQDAVLDDDGNIVTEAVEAVEAKDAYTRRDVYETAEEAPEGAVEVTLQSVRYNELMAFVGAATEQRLTSIEARLTALEA